MHPCRCWVRPSGQKLRFHGSVFPDGADTPGAYADHFTVHGKTQFDPVSGLDGLAFFQQPDRNVIASQHDYAAFDLGKFDPCPIFPDGHDPAFRVGDFNEFCIRWVVRVGLLDMEDGVFFLSRGFCCLTAPWKERVNSCKNKENRKDC